MMYFIPWVVLLAFVILAVPIVSWLDNRKLRAAYGETNDALGDEDDGFGEDEQDDASADEAAAEEGGDNDVLDGGDDFAGEDEFGGEDFSAFEEVR